ncbi:MAG TPA: restriction endonuclease subunit S [Candidatus Dojkabacteria bacterium]|nr:restriction endonuclease subunit S [Candidatus Dojkabacteria bacterium]
MFCRKKLRDLNIKIIDGDRGKNYPKSDDLSENGDCVFLSADNIQEGTFDFSHTKFISLEKDNLMGNGKLFRGDLVLTTRGTVGRFAYYGDDVTFSHIRINSGMVIIRNMEESLDTRYLQLFMGSSLFAREVTKAVFGSAQPQLTLDLIGNFKINTPIIEEQKEIVSTIEKWDKYIELLDKKIEVKKNVEKYLIQNLLSYKTIKKDYLKEHRLGDIVSVLKGRGLSKAVLDDNGQEECILYGELYTTYGDIIDEVSSRTNISEGVRSVKGDVLVPASTTTNALDVATASCLMRDDVLLGGDINIFRPKKDIDGEFLAYYLSYAKKLDMARLAQGITIVHLYGSDLRKMSVTIPPLQEQKEIVRILTQSNKEIELLENKKTLMEQQRKYLINNLVTGNIRLPKFKNNK